MAISAAQQAAYQAYLNAKLNLDTEELAFKKAQQAFTESVQKAGLTGMYEGAPTQAAMQYYANTFGTWAQPGQGAETQAAQQQKFTQAQQLAQMYGQYYQPGGSGPAQGTQTQAAQEQAYTQWLRSQQELRAQQAQQQQTANQYLTLLSNLRGPADWAKYQQVLGATPNGMRDLVAAAMGQYVPGGGATTGVQPTAVSLQSLLGDVTGAGQGQYGAPGGKFAAGGTAMPEGYMQGITSNIPNAMYGQQPGAEAAGGGTNTMGAGGTGGLNFNLPAPNQIAAQSWKNLAPSQQQMLLGQYEASGWNKDDVTALMNQGLPRYASNATAAGTFRLNPS